MKELKTNKLRAIHSTHQQLKIPPNLEDFLQLNDIAKADVHDF